MVTRRMTPIGKPPMRAEGGNGILRPSGRIGPDGVEYVGTPVPINPGDWRAPAPVQAHFERDVAISGSILDQVVPMVYGSVTVGGQIGAYYYNSTTKVINLGIVFAYGEQHSISTSTTYVNGEVITSATGVTNEAVAVGDGSTTLSTVLTGMTGWTAADTTLWKSLAHAVCTINCSSSQIPAALVFTSKLGGRKCTPIGGGTAAVSANPAVIAYDILTSADWAGLSTAKIDEDSFLAVAAWCDEVMGDSSKRYEFNGVLRERDPWDALKIVLGHCLAYPYITTDGKVALWCDMMPAAVTGEWSASASATITEDSTAGAATTELTAGDYVYVGTNLRRVSSVTNDDTVVLDSAVTVSGVAVRPLSGVYIKKYDWVAPPAASESNLLQTPDQYRLRFADDDAKGSHEVLVSYGAGTTKIIETQLVGCTSASVATRIGETHLKVAHLEPFFWGGVVGNATAGALEPGDVVLFDDDLLTMQAARVLPPLQARPDGTYVIQLREFDPSAYSDSTDTTDTLPSLGTAWTSAGAPVFSAIHTYYSGTIYDGVTYDGSGRQVFGDGDAASTVTGTQVRLPNNVPLYGLKTGGTTVGLVMCDSSDRIVLGDGSEECYINTSGDIIVPDAFTISAGFTSKDAVIENDATYFTVGVGNRVTRLTGGNGVRIGINSTAAADPTTTNFPSGYGGIHKNSSSGTVYFAYNDGGTIRKVALS